jgi:phosphopantetheinyl transferase (holo-ACP synthase)
VGELANLLAQKDIPSLHGTLSHDGDLALAVVVLER